MTSGVTGNAEAHSCMQYGENFGASYAHLDSYAAHISVLNPNSVLTTSVEVFAVEPAHCVHMLQGCRIVHLGCASTQSMC